jgi:hypothetical protein
LPLSVEFSCSWSATTRFESTSIYRYKSCMQNWYSSWNRKKGRNK